MIEGAMLSWKSWWYRYSECQQVSAKSDDLDIDRDVTSDIDESGQCVVV